MGVHSASILPPDAIVAWECGKLRLSMHVLNAITPPAPTSINRVMERPSERTCSLTFHVLFHSIARVRSFRVRASLSLSLPLPLKGRGCDARDVAGSWLAFVRPHLALSPSSSLSLSPSFSRPRSLACSLPFPIQSSEAFADSATLRRFFRLSHISSNFYKHQTSAHPCVLCAFPS